MEENEYRFFDGSEFRVENREGKDYLRGYGIVFNSDSKVLYGMFIERITPGALDKADMSEIISKYNHDVNRTLGTTWAGTLKYGIDKRGVWYEVELPDTATGNEVKVLAQRGDLRGSSFEFRPNKEGVRWFREKRGDLEVEIREITNIAIVRDLSPVISPAYPATEKMSKLYKRDMQEAGLIPEEIKDRDAALIEEEMRFYLG